MLERKVASLAPRALFIITELSANGGIQRFNRTLLAALETLQIECDVLSMHDAPQSASGHMTESKVRIRGFQGSRWRFTLGTVAAIWGQRYDWILIGHINLLAMSLAAMATNPFRGGRTLLIAHGIEVWYRIGFLRRQSLRRCSTVLCVSDYTRRRILEQTPSLQPDRLQLFPNALCNTWERPALVQSPRELPRRFLLSVTRLEKGDRYKGVVTVLEALSMLSDTAMHYVVVGQGHDLGFLTWVAARHGVLDRVQFLNAVTDLELIDLYRRCEAFVLPSGKEGFGIVFLEAMFFGAPVIAAAEKGTLDVVKPDETGLLVRFGDAIALRQAIERMASDVALREHVRSVGRATVIEHGKFTFSRFVQRTAEALGLPAPAMA